MRSPRFAVVVAAAVLLACTDSAPVAPFPSSGPALTRIANSGSGVQKNAIAGAIALVSLDPPTRSMETPSGMCRSWNVLEHTRYSGDVVGDVTYVANTKGDCAFNHLVVSGTFGGRVTYQGRTGDIAGQWETNCKFDAALGSLSCGGISNARGSGGLEGIQFHIRWGPGWWPFSYSGTAFVQ